MDLATENGSYDAAHPVVPSLGSFAFPPELQLMVAKSGNLTTGDLRNLACTCRTLYANILPLVYRHDYDSGEYRALQVGASYGDIPLLRRVIESCGNGILNVCFDNKIRLSNTCYSKKMWHAWNLTTITPLIVAIYNGNVDTVRFLLSQGADVNLPARYSAGNFWENGSYRENVDCHPIHCVLNWYRPKSHLEILAELLLHGANPNHKPDSSSDPSLWVPWSGVWFPLTMAMYDGVEVEAVNLLLENGATQPGDNERHLAPNPNRPHEHSPLHAVTTIPDECNPTQVLAKFQLMLQNHPDPQSIATDMWADIIQNHNEVPFFLGYRAYQRDMLSILLSLDLLPDRTNLENITFGVLPQWMLAMNQCISKEGYIELEDLEVARDMMAMFLRCCIRPDFPWADECVFNGRQVTILQGIMELYKWVKPDGAPVLDDILHKLWDHGARPQSPLEWRQWMEKGFSFDEEYKVD
ncbi:hypothetical protein F5B20DRAFT_581710 [Whalleya microplaca]|nr:hypothetical protein F5B20DRAFT_581710 [Whalleya microplaca]